MNADERHNFFSNPNSPCYGTYMNDGIRRIDYIMAYQEEEKKEEGENKERRNFYEENCEKEGIELERDRVEMDGETLVFIKVHVPWKVLCQQAEVLEIKGPLWIHDKPVIKKNAQPEPNKKLRMYGKNTIINWPFKRKHMERYAIRDQSTFFTAKQRIEVAFEMLQTIGNHPHDPHKRGLEMLLEEKVYESAYPLHDSDVDMEVPDTHDDQMPKRHELCETWASWKEIMHRQPLHEIRDYFGEKIGFYYAFMDCYTRMLIYPAIAGLIVFLIGIFFAAYSSDIQEICNYNHLNESIQEGHLEEEIYEHNKRVKMMTTGTGEYNTDETLEPEEFETETYPSTSKDFEAGVKYYMCPICEPPNCEDWELIGSEACFYYSWAFRFDNPLSFLLSGFTTLWAIIFIKLWKRRESCLAIEWNVQDIEEKELVIRPEYEERAPTQRKNPVTHELEPYIPFSKRAVWMSGSIMATVFFLFFACACLIALVISRIQLYGLLKKIPGPIGEKNIDCARWLIHGMLFVVVTILESVYGKIAHKLTAYECPKTEKKFMDSLLWKIFVFAMLNDIIPLGYAAWVKGRTVNTPLELGVLDELCDAGCMGEVTELVAVLLVLRLIIGNITEIGIPLFKKFWNRKKKQTKEEQPNFPQYVKDFHLNEVEFDGVYEEYMEMMIQFAFIVLFIPALPVAPFLCFLNNIAEIRVDGIKMVQTSRRPLPIRVSGIGIWNKFLDILSRMGIVCNAALLAFTSDNVLYLYYVLVQSPGLSLDGFIKFTLSKIPVENFKPSQGEEMVKKNITYCWYPGFRQTHEPYDVKDNYWEITAFRMMVFATYCLIFLIITWAVNTFVSDVPESVTIKTRRQHHLVVKSIEAESAAKVATMVASAWNSKPKSS